MYVSTTLETVEWRASSDPDISIGNSAFRRLDPKYYAYLRRMFLRAEQAAREGRVPHEAFQQLRSRFMNIRNHAIHSFGENALREVLLPADYAPPIPQPPLPTSSANFLFPQEGDFPFSKSVPFEHAFQVDHICDRALELGWTIPMLYQNRANLAFPIGPEWGLVCFLHPGDAIGKIGAAQIEIIRCKRRGITLRFPKKEAISQ